MKMILSLVCVCALAACGEDEPSMVDTEGCALLDGGMFTAVTTVVSRDQSTPPVSASMGYTATLPASGIGYVRFEATAGRYVAFLDRDVAVIALEGAGTPATVSSSASSEACATVKARHAFELAAGTAYLGIGPDAGGPVNVALVPAS